MSTAPMHDRPLAAPGLTSYRYRGRYGWIMIGARNHAEALREAERSNSGRVTMDNLQVWRDGAYAWVSLPAETDRDREALREQIQREHQLQAWRDRGVL